MALYALDDEDAMPVAPWSVHDPYSIVPDVAYPIALFWLPKVETL
jgi:hypothetical protein